MSELTRSERKRAAILEAAAAEFRSGGFRDTSMDRIAEVAGVSKRTVYNHFESKEALFRAITADLLQQLSRVEHGDYDPDRSLADQLTEIASQEVAVFTSDHFVGMARAFFAEAFRSPEAVREAFEQSVGEDAIQVWVRQAAAAGALDVREPAMAAAQLSALLKGPLFWPRVLGISDGKPIPPADVVIAESVKMFLCRYAPGS